MFGKAENETMPFGKELEVATPQETPDGYGAAVGGTSEEGLPMDSPHRAVRRCKTSETGEKASCGKGTVSVKWSISHLMGHSDPKDHLKKMGCWSDIICDITGLLVHGGSHGENCIKGCDNSQSRRSVFEPRTFSVYGHSVCSSLVLRFLAHVCWPCYPLSSLNKPAFQVNNPFESSSEGSPVDWPIWDQSDEPGGMKV